MSFLTSTRPFLKPALVIILMLITSDSHAAKVVVFSSLDEAINILKSQNWWGEEKHGEQLQVPHLLMTKLPIRWQRTSVDIPVSQKKEIFYRFMLPLVLHANDMVLDRRRRLQRLSVALGDHGVLEAEDMLWLESISRLLRISRPASDSGSINKAIEQALYKLDIIPAGLALGQAAYESGYGTSRFAAKGNALFGQWTFGGEGLIPEQQRKSLGDHRIASYTWLFDSVRAYFINLNSHPAYASFRQIRAQLKAEGKPLDSLVLADGLTAYSERGQAYVDTLKGIIRVNKLHLADGAEFRNEELSFIIGVEDEMQAQALRIEIEDARGAGELQKIIERMRLE